MKKRKAISLTLLCLTLLTFAAAFAIMLPLYTRYQPVSYRSIPGYETAVLLKNPFRGFYHIYGFILSEDAADAATGQVLRHTDSGSLVLLEINLKNYAASNLSDSAGFSTLGLSS